MKAPTPPQYTTWQPTEKIGARWPVIVPLLLVGVALWLSVGRGIIDWPKGVAPLICGGTAVLLMLVPAVRKLSVEGLQVAERRLEHHITLSAVCIGILAAAYFAFTAIRQGRYLHPHWHDELSYVIQMRMLAQGKLWMGAHPVGEFFETFYLLTDGIYASIYFPGTALLYVPEIWLRLPLVALPICATGACVGLTYWILAKLVDPLSGLIGALLMIAIPIVRLMSVMVMSNMPVLLMGLLLLVAFIHWQQHRRLRWAVAMGIFAGWAAVCRPLEATCFAVPVGLGILLRLRGWSWSKRLASIGLVLLGAAPFLTLQVIMNQHITGDWRTPAWQYYSNRDFPQTTMGFRKFDPAIRPVSKLPQKQDIFDQFVPDVVNNHQPAKILNLWVTFRGPVTVAGTMPYSVLLILLPLGVAVCKGQWRWVVAGVLLVFILLSTISVVFQVYYPLAVIPSVLLLVLLGIGELSRALASHGQLVRTILLIWIALMALSALPESDRSVRDQFFAPTLMAQVDQWESDYPGGRALVLFRYSRQRRIHEEPVYNASVAWPDEARVVRAQDLGDQNRKLFAYYAKIQPDREVFLFDEGSRQYTRLGMVGELAK